MSDFADPGPNTPTIQSMARNARRRFGSGWEAGKRVSLLHPAGADHAGAARHGRRRDRGARLHQAHGRGGGRRAMGADAVHRRAGAGGALRGLARAGQFRRRAEDHHRNALRRLHAGGTEHRGHDRAWRSATRASTRCWSMARTSGSPAGSRRPISASSASRRLRSPGTRRAWCSGCPACARSTRHR